MGLKSSFKGCKEPQCDDLIVDKNIGTSYDVVREVYDALPWLEDLYNDAPEDAPGDSKTYGRQSGNWVEVTEEAPNDGQGYVRKDSEWVIEAGADSVEEAPEDSTAYNRQNADWVAVEVTEAPNNSTKYVRSGAIWVAETEGLSEAPETGSPYGREDLGWVAVTEEAPDNATSYVRKGAEWIPETTGIPEANTDSKYYGRFNSSWAEVTEEAADDSQSYVRKSKGWVLETTGIPDATSDGTAYGREDAGWVSVTEEAPDTATGYVRKGKAWVAESDGEVEEAPTDGSVYGRESSNWVEVSEEAPDSGLEYVRKNKGWVQNSGGGGGIGEAPQDGTPYNREDANWVSVDVLEAPEDGTGYVRQDGSWVSETSSGGIGEAPENGTPYNREDAGWVAVEVQEAPQDSSNYVRNNATWVSETVGMGEAPTDGSVYVRNGLAADWEVGVPEANNNTITYGRKGLAWVAVPEEANQDTKSYVRKDGGWVEESPGEVEEAPQDNTGYVRKNAVWVAELVGISEAPDDSQEYVRKNEDWAVSSGITDANNDSSHYGRSGEAWAAVTEEAPDNGSEYVRKNKAWAVSSGGGGGIPEAPVDGSVYVRNGSTTSWEIGVLEADDDSVTYGREGLAWTPVTEEAPDNGDEYVRKNKTWAVASGGGGGGDSASMPEVTFEANRTQWGDKLAASGFVHFGKHQDTGDYTPINQGLFARVNSGSHTDLLYMGDSNSGESKTDSAVTSIANVITNLDDLNIGSDPKKGKIKFPGSPDGTVTYNTATGEILKHGSISGAFAAESTDVSVVTERVDMWGFEQFLRKIENTDKGKWVFPNGLIQSKAVNINGISTVSVPSGDIPDTYFAVFHYTATDGTVIETDTSSRGLGVDWFSLSSLDQDTILADPANKIYRDSSGDLLVHEIRQRTIPGVGNGDFTDLNVAGSSAMLNKTAWYVPPQGELDELKTGVTLGNSDNGFYVPPNDSGNRADKSKLGHYTSQKGIGDDFAVNDECYFLSLGTVPRLNQGAFHPNSNLFGAAQFSDSDNWWETSASSNDTEDCFTNPVGGDVSSGISGRDDGRYYDVIYPGGQGGVIDYRYSAWGKSTVGDAAKGRRQLELGTYRGKEGSTLVEYIGDSGNSSGTSEAYTLKLTVPGGTYDNLPKTSSSVPEPIDGYITLVGVQHRIHSYKRAEGSGSLYLLSDTLSDTGEDTGQAWSDNFMWLPLDATSVSGERTYQTVIGTASAILSTSDLGEGWVGKWCTVIPDGSSQAFPLSRKSLSATLTQVSTSNGGTSWTRDSAVAYDEVANTYTASVSSSTVIVNSYGAWAYQTEASDNTAIFNGRGGQATSLFLSADHKPEEGCVLAESLIAKALTSDSDFSRSTDLVPSIMGRMQPDGKLSNVSGHFPEHRRVIVEEPTNQGSGIKVFASQISIDNQISLQFHTKELFYDPTADDEGEATVISTSVSYDYLEGEFYKFDHANFGDFDQMYVISATEFSTAAGQIAGYTQIGDIILSVNGRLRFYIWTGDASAWGDNGFIDIVDGNDTTTDINGNTVVTSCHRLAIPIGWIKNEH